MSQPTRILLALILGLALGLACASAGGAWLAPSVTGAEIVGGLWLNGLQMTIVPLVVSLLVTGIAATAKAARASRVATRALILFVILLWISAGLAALLTPLLLDIWPLPQSAAEALRTAVAGTAAPAGAVPGIADFFRSIVPTNPVAAAANDAFLPLILFTLVFAFALTRIPEGPRDQLIGFFRAISDVMLVVIGWVLWLAPIGVTALAYAVGAKAGTAAFGALLHYVAIISAVGIVIWGLAYPLALFGARERLGRFARAAAPSQAVAISTQSSLASLPAMLRGSESLGVPVALSGIVLPMAVAIFRVTGPAMNLAVAFYVAHIFGIDLGPGQIAAGVAAAATTTLGAVSLPGQVSFITSIAPICIVMGIPIEPLALLIAVETIPDIFRTLGNVTMDVAATATVARRSGIAAEEVASEQDA
ncbi:MAG TPA: cation:dicarboxylase symporter family transporter, partial [Allosphingosinicella sp.]